VESITWVQIDWSGNNTSWTDSQRTSGTSAYSVSHACQWSNSANCRAYATLSLGYNDYLGNLLLLKKATGASPTFAVNNY
jgi:hypothetical protein